MASARVLSSPETSSLNLLFLDIFGLIGNFHEFHQVIIDRSHSPQVNEQHHLSSTEVCEHHRLIDSDALADSPEHSVMAQESV